MNETEEWITTQEEIMAYLGFTIMMGLNQLPHIYDYWSTDSLFHNFEIASRISRNRFVEIKRYLHFVDNRTLVERGEEGYDKLGKIRPILDLVRQRTLNNHNPHKENSIDKAMIKYKGRSSLKQYLPMKPIKRGMNVWVRVDSCNGYVCDFHVYTGKEGNNTTLDLGGSVVKKLTRDIIGKNYHLYYDNYFTSVALLESLLKDKVYSCGIFRRDRKGIPVDLKDVRMSKWYKKNNNDNNNNNFLLIIDDLERGDFVFRRCGNIVALVWKDNKLVYMISTNANPSVVSTCQRKDKDGTVKTVPAPLAINLYNKFMGGVDRADQLRSYYP